jgi:hypothetical protein
VGVTTTDMPESAARSVSSCGSGPGEPPNPPVTDRAAIPVHRPRTAIAVLPAHLFLSALVVYSIIQTRDTVLGVAHEMSRPHDAVAIGSLAAALLPAGTIIFWGLKAIAVQLRAAIAALQRQQRPRWAAEGEPAAIAAPAPGPRPGGWIAAAIWMGAAFAAALGLTIAVLAGTGIGGEDIGSALRLTGRLSFLLFWPAYVGAATATLCGPRFGLSPRRRREFGLAYAAAQFVHFGLVVLLLRVTHRPLVSGLMPFFFVGIVWTYVLALLSFDRLGNGLGADLRRLFLTVGLEYITLAFFADFVIGPIGGGVASAPRYLPFAILTVAGPVLRMSANIRGAIRRAGSAP